MSDFRVGDRVLYSEPGRYHGLPVTIVRKRAARMKGRGQYTIFIVEDGKGIRRLAYVTNLLRKEEDDV